MAGLKPSRYKVTRRTDVEEHNFAMLGLRGRCKLPVPEQQVENFCRGEPIEEPFNG